MSDLLTQLGEKSNLPTPKEIIKEAQKKYNIKRFVGLFSGGKDSLTMCHYVDKLGYLDEVLYLKTGIGTQENFEFVLNTCNKYNWKLTVADPKPQFTYERFVAKFGFPHAGIHPSVMAYLKLFQIRQFGKDHKKEGIAFLSGRRKKESNKRRKMKSNLPYSKIETNVIMVSPMLYWNNGQVSTYINNNNLEICPVYETLHMSGDCLCGAFSTFGESDLIKTFHPELAKTIVGLEQKYGGKWGNQISMTGATKQNKISQYVCSECIYDSNK